MKRAYVFIVIICALLLITQGRAQEQTKEGVPGDYKVTITWQTPTTDSDGSPLGQPTDPNNPDTSVSDLAGFKLYVDDVCSDVENLIPGETEAGNGSGFVDEIIEIGPEQNTFVIDDIRTHGYTLSETITSVNVCFAVTAYDDAGNESARSQVFSKNFHYAPPPIPNPPPSAPILIGID